MMSDTRPMYDAYQDFYARVQRSGAFRAYCRELFGEDLSQDGFADIDQLNMLIRKLGIGADDTCLEIGCGNGKTANYVFGKTKAKVHGVDYSQNAILYAREKYASDYLSFSVGDINSLDIEKESYSIVYLVD